MRIGLLADTHIPVVVKALPPQVIDAFRGVDLILHAGDMYDISVLDDLERVAPVLAAKGDDDYAYTLKDRRVKVKHVLELQHKTLWLVHVRGYQFLSPWWDELVTSTSNNRPDIVIYGHLHRTIVECFGDTLFVNPGSPTFLNYHHGLGTVGILELDSDKADVEIIQLQEDM